MSSKPNVIVAPRKKKKKKPLVIISKAKKSVAGVREDVTAVSTATPPYGASSARPASPRAVVAATTDDSPVSGPCGATAGSKRCVKNGRTRASGSIVIRPFERPPELPPDFYDSSLVVLRRALTCVLRHEALTAAVPDKGEEPRARDRNDKGRPRLISREELYRSVEDLCVHRYGERLYQDVVAIMEDAAGRVVRRLASPGGMGGINDDRINDESLLETAGWSGVIVRNTGDVEFDTSRLTGDLNLRDGGYSYDPSRRDCNYETEYLYMEKRYSLLQRMHSVCRISYAEEYLTFVRSIFLALDRAYVFISNFDLEEIGWSMYGETSNEPVPGRVLERSLSASSINRNSAKRIWGMWEVGIACLRRHMLRCPATLKARSDNQRIVDVEGPSTLPVLPAMVLTTAHTILSEYDSSSQSFSSASNSLATMGDMRPLVRNCVRTIIDLGALLSLLKELIIIASARFENEGKWWTIALNESKRAASEYLLHVENRLSQGAGMMTYFLPSNPSSSVALRQLARLPSLVGAVPSLTPNTIVWLSGDSSTRRMLPAIIEKRLLGPQLSPRAGIMEPRHLYPILDDDDGSASAAHGSSTSGVNTSEAWKNHHSGSKTYNDAKRLYSLCWRMTRSLTLSLGADSKLGSGSGAPQSALTHLRIAFGEYGRLRGSEIMKQGTSSGKADSNSKEIEKRVVPDLLAFKNHLCSLHTIAFRSDDDFGATIKSILEDVLNGATTPTGETHIKGDDGDGGRRTAELLAKHIDTRFRDAKARAFPTAAPTPTADSQHPSTFAASLVGAAIAADASESFQNEILALFRHIHSKDVFEAFYKRDLAKRLLTGRAVSTDMEKSFLSKLKAECGAGYTSKMEGMFKDMDLSRDIMAAARPLVMAPSAGGRSVEMDVQVLTTGYWPVYPKYPNIILPPELLSQKSKFESYYNDKYQGRRIAWQYSLGNCIVKALFPKSASPKELIVNVCQSLVLLCFRLDDGPGCVGLTMNDIAKRTGIEDRGELERVLQSLSMGRDGTRVLRKVDHDSALAQGSGGGGGRDDSPRKKAKKGRIRRSVGNHDRFFFNSSFTSNQRRIRITNITMKETAAERSKTHAAVSKDRLYLIDAAVVRIMKARKAMGHRDLVGEVMSQLKFPASGADVKRRIESLIEREYMERVKGDRARYKYMA